MQLDKWLRSLDRTSVFTPSEVDRKRVTSFMHSLNPALYLLRTVASAESAAGRETRHMSEATVGPWSLKELMTFGLLILSARARLE